MAEHPDVGDRAPAIDLPSTQGHFNLHERLSDGPVLLVFHPKDRTLICTRQLCNYQDNLSMFHGLGVQLAAINHDSMEAHNAFSDRYKFEFPLVSDVERTYCDAYDALTDLWKLRRIMVLIREDGRICWRHSEFRAFYRRARELKQVIESLKADASL